MIQLKCACVAGVCCIPRIPSVTLKLVSFVDLLKHFILVYFLASPSFQVPAVCLICVSQSCGSAAIRFRLPADKCDSTLAVEFFECNRCCSIFLGQGIPFFFPHDNVLCISKNDLQRDVVGGNRTYKRCQGRWDCLLWQQCCCPWRDFNLW